MFLNKAFHSFFYSYSPFSKSNIKFGEQAWFSVQEPCHPFPHLNSLGHLFSKCYFRSSTAEPPGVLVKPDARAPHPAYRTPVLYCALLSRVWPCDPRDCGPPGSPAHGIFQAGILQWVAISYSRGSSQSRDWTRVSCIRRQILYHRATWEAHIQS